MLVGPSGCGKTTLLSVVAAILQPTSGNVSVLGNDLPRLSSWRRTAFRRDNVGFVYQQFNLFPALTAAENAAVPLVIQGYSKWKAVAAAKALLGKMGMDDRVNYLPGKLSGGQQQRVDRRALIHRPHLLRAMNPRRPRPKPATILELLRDCRGNDQAVIIVTHDSRILSLPAIARMDEGTSCRWSGRRNGTACHNRIRFKRYEGASHVHQIRSADCRHRADCVRGPLSESGTVTDSRDAAADSAGRESVS
jgi:putative ABC transport system ATP-binding protein